MDGNDISNGFQDMIRGLGDRVDIHTQVCVEWYLNHTNCQGCSSGLGCAKTVAMLGISLIPTIYEPKDFADFEAMHDTIRTNLDKVLHAQTIEEVKAARW